MEQYKQDFIEFMVRSRVLTFGDFVTKSGRKTPFFINTGNYKTGEQLAQLGAFYAHAIVKNFTDPFSVLFGPAYKGIPLATAATISLYLNHGRSIAYCFNRKEAKDHGEGGMLVGHRLSPDDRVIIIEDVVTAGSSVRETQPLITSTGASLVGLIVSVDRMERGTGSKSALAEIAETMCMKVCAIVTLDEVVNHLYNRSIDGKIILDDQTKSRIDEYRNLYGASA